jgi:hypothetical protein
MDGHGNRTPEVIEQVVWARTVLPRWQFREWRQPELSFSDGEWSPSDQGICETITLSCDDNRKSLLCQPGQDAALTIFNTFWPCTQVPQHYFYQE